MQIEGHKSETSDKRKMDFNFIKKCDNGRILKSADYNHGDGEVEKIHKGFGFGMGMGIITLFGKSPFK